MIIKAARDGVVGGLLGGEAENGEDGIEGREGVPSRGLDHVQRCKTLREPRGCVPLGSGEEMLGGAMVSLDSGKWKMLGSLGLWKV